MKTSETLVRTFGNECIDWEKDQNFNLVFLKSIVSYFNSVLNARKYLFLRDIFERLGFSVTRSIIGKGWFVDERDNNFDLSDYIFFHVDVSNQ